MALKYGLDVPTTREYADARKLADLAAEAERAGWDGFFLWDVWLDTQPVIDIWVALTAVALSTQRLRFGPFVLPLARHRPWMAARRLANLDQLSNGRVICTVGLGYLEQEFSAVDEDPDPRRRAARLDEGLQVMQGLWKGESFSFDGEYFHLDQVTIQPTPVQQSRIPIWAAAGWPNRAPVRRAVRWDGLCIQAQHAREQRPLTLEEVKACLAYAREQRSQSHGADAAPFDVVLTGETPGGPAAAGIVRPLAEAEATWWVEEGYERSYDELRQRIRQGPPRDI